MRWIQKQPEPPSFTAWKASGNQDWQPSYGDLRGSLKQDVVRSLGDEQGWVCCYCERRISGDPVDSHIEHLVPQSADPSRALDYANLLCSCNSNSVHCGHKKSGGQLQMHPLDRDCETSFEFASSGGIAARGRRLEQARATIAILGLDAPPTRTRRREACGVVLEQIDGMPPTEVQQMIPVLLQRDHAGRHVPHATAIVFVLRALLNG